jgi:hypothetical protein
VAQVIDALQHRAEVLAVVDHAADGNSAEADPVVAALAADEACARTFAAHAVVGDRNLQRRVHGLGAGVREEHAVEALGRDLHQRVRELERDGVAHLERRCVVHHRNLFRDRLGDFLAAVARIDAPETGRGVEHLAAVGRPVVQALGARKEAGTCLELPVRGERHPEGVEIFRDCAHDN